VLKNAEELKELRAEVKRLKAELRKVRKTLTINENGWFAAKERIAELEGNKK
jgi:chromosome segregation ATPase